MSLVHDHSFEPRHGEPVDVAPGVRRVTAPNVGPFTFQGTNTYLIGVAEIAVLDPGPADESHVEALLRAIGSARVAHVLLSHGHRDHSGAARMLQARTGAPILAALPNRPLSEASAPTPPDVVLTDGAVLAAGGLQLQAIATPGHAADHLAFALAGRDLLFSGDHVMGWSTTVVAPPDGLMADYMQSLNRLLARRERLYLPAHGGAISDAHPYMRGLRRHRLMRERAILEGIGAGDRTIAELVERVYRDLDPRLARGAALSTLAHLQDLVARELVRTDGEPEFGSLYWPAGAPDG